MSVVEFRDDQRSTKASPELVSLHGVASREEVGCIQLIVAEVLEQGSVYPVGARLRYDIDYAAHPASILRIERAGLNRELLHSIRIRKGQRRVRVAVIVVAVVEQEVGSVARASR